MWVDIGFEIALALDVRLDSKSTILALLLQDWMFSTPFTNLIHCCIRGGPGIWGMGRTRGVAALQLQLL